MNDIRIAVVCSSNMNRSMEAHAFLVRRGFNVKSFGTGDKVRLPGTSVNRPNCYEFGVPYEDIYNDLSKRNKSYYTQCGILGLLGRNKRVKLCPEQLQMSTEKFDVIITCEERIYHEVIRWFDSKWPVHCESVHIINVNIKDNLEDALLGAFLIKDLLMKITESDDFKKNVKKLLREFKADCHKPIRSCRMFY